MSELSLSAASPRIAASVPRAPTKNGKRTFISRKLKAALDAMVFETDGSKALPWIDAARKAGFSAVAMRQALERPHVQTYLRAQRQVLRAAICAANLPRLAEIRDQNSNLNAAVSAVKLLEQMDDPEHARGPAAPFSGVVVNIITAPGDRTVHAQAGNAAQVIDNTEDSQS